MDSDLEAFSQILRRIALHHWLFSQPYYESSEPMIPLIPSWVTIGISNPSVGLN
ncbi:hypothetical protein ACHAWF_006072 [Thalassiosira exigua]